MFSASSPSFDALKRLHFFVSAEINGNEEENLHSSEEMNEEEEHLHTNLTTSSSSSFVSTKEVQEETEKSLAK